MHAWPVHMTKSVALDEASSYAICRLDHEQLGIISGRYEIALNFEGTYIILCVAKLQR